MIGFPNQLLAIAIVFSFIYVVVSQYVNMEEYNSFLSMVDQQEINEQSERNRKYCYTGGTNLGKYGTNRHGAQFIKCRDYNSSRSDKPVNLRCPVRPGNYHAVCQLTYDYESHEVTQSCFDVPFRDEDTCRRGCNLKFQIKQFEGHPHMNKRVGFCCCKSNMCNTDLEYIIATGIRRSRENIPEFKLPPQDKYLHAYLDDEDKELAANSGLQSYFKSARDFFK